MKEGASQSILDARGSRRQFLEFVAGVGTGAAAGVLARSQDVYAQDAAPAATQDTEDNTTETVAAIGGGVVGGIAGFVGGTVEAQVRLNKWNQEGKVPTQHDKETAAMTVGPLYQFGGIALGGGLGAGIGYGAVKLARRIF